LSRRTWKADIRIRLLRELSGCSCVAGSRFRITFP
jgi:hypothetical protein